MHALVLESDPDVGADAREQLGAAGHEVSRCHEPGQGAFPCNGVSGACPLDRGDVDLILTVREPHREGPTPLEDGVTCGIRNRIPLVVAGTSDHPYQDYAARTIDPGADVVTACEATASHALAPHGAIAAAAAREVLANHGVESDVVARVVRREGRLRAQIVVSANDVPWAIITTRVLAALRRFDPSTPGIDVAVRRS